MAFSDNSMIKDVDLSGNDIRVSNSKYDDNEGPDFGNINPSTRYTNDSKK
jgi:hypothetical protein